MRALALLVVLASSLIVACKSKPVPQPAAPIDDSSAPSAAQVAIPVDAAPDPERQAREQAALDVMRGSLPDGGLQTLAGTPPIPPPTIGTGRYPRINPGRTITTPQLRQGAITVNGRLPPEVIQRIVRQNFGRFRLCYENGLRNNPALQGRVTAKFVIGVDGSVTTAADGGSDIPDQTVTQCVIRGFQNLSFPQPEGGIVTVIFPLIFSPGD